ncbi:MAG: hypothetical protein JEY97_15180 [Bacteroidales bacterium]|nr:hypothetical protein [Bacteroidales bacterium]
MLIKAFISLFLIPLFIGNIFAQKIVFTENFPISYSEIKYEKRPDRKQKINNTIISEIGANEPLSLSDIFFPIFYNLNISISESYDDNFILRLTVKEIEIKRDIIIKGFNISNLIFPSNVDLTILLSGLKNENNLEISFEDVLIENNGIIISEEIPNSDVSKLRKLSARLKYLKFFFNEADEKLIEKRLITIFDYLATELIINKTIKKIEGIDVENSAITPEIFLNVKEMNRIVKIISEKDFSELSQNERDQHYNFEEKLDVLNRKALRMNTIFEKTLYKNQEIYIAEPITELIDKYVDLSSIYYDESSKVPHTFTSSVAKLSNINSGNIGIFQFIDVINDLIKKSNLQSFQFDYDEISSFIVDGMIRKSSKYISSERFNEALDVLNNAKSICNIVPCEYNYDDLFTNFSRAKYGIYHSFISVAERAIKANNYEIAENYLDQAINFQIENSEYIISNIPTEKVVLKFVYDCILAGEIELSNKNYPSSLVDFYYASKYINMISDENLKLRLQNGIQKAEKLNYENDILLVENYVRNQETFKNEKFDETLNHRENENIHFTQENRKLRDLKQKVENKDITSQYLKAKEYFFSGLYEEAYNRLQEIKKSDCKISNYQASEIDDFQAIVVKSLIKNKIDVGVSKAWQNDFESANEILNYSEMLLEEANIKDDNNTNESIKNLKERIMQNECIIVKDKYDVLIIKGKRIVRQKDFIGAVACFDEAKTIFNQNIKCNISDSMAFQLHELYFHASEYQNNSKKLNSDLYSKGFRSIIEQYISLEDYYNGFRIDTFGIQHTTFYDFVKSQNSPEMAIFSINYFISKNRPEKAIRMLNILEGNNYPMEKTKDVQIQLGRLLAKKDFLIMPQAKPEKVFIKYSKKYNAYKVLKKEYLKAWKKMYALNND